MAFSFGNWKKPKGHSPEPSPKEAAPPAKNDEDAVPEASADQGAKPKVPRGDYQGMVVKPIPIHEPLSSKQQKKISARIHIPPISLRNPDDGSPPPKAKLTSPMPPAPAASQFAPIKGPMPPAPAAGGFAPPPPRPLAQPAAPEPVAEATEPVYAEAEAETAPEPEPEVAAEEQYAAYAEPEVEAQAEAEPEAFQREEQEEPQPMTGIPTLPVIPMSPSLRVPNAPQGPAAEPPPAPEPQPRTSLLRPRQIPLPPPSFSPRRTASIAHPPSYSASQDAPAAPAQIPMSRPATPLAPPRLSSLDSKQTELAPSVPQAPHLARQARAEAATAAEGTAEEPQHIVYNPANNPYAVQETPEYQEEAVYEEEDQGEVAVAEEEVNYAEEEVEPAAEAEQPYAEAEEEEDVEAAAEEEDYSYSSSVVYQSRMDLVSAVFMQAPPRIPAPPKFGPRIEESDERLENGHRPILKLREGASWPTSQPVAAPTPPPAPVPPPPPPAGQILPPPPPPRAMPVTADVPRPINFGSVPTIPLETKRLVVAKGQTPLLPPPPTNLARTPKPSPPAFPPAPVEATPTSFSDEEVIDFGRAVQELGLPESFQESFATPAPVLPPPPPPFGLATPPPPPPSPPPVPEVEETAAPVFEETAAEVEAEAPAVEEAYEVQAEAEPEVAEYAPAEEEAESEEAHPAADYLTGQPVFAESEPLPEYAPEAELEPEPEPALAHAETTAQVTAEAEQENPAMFELMGDHTVDARKIAQAICRLPGLSHCVIMFNDGLLLAGELPDTLNIEALSAIAPQFLNKVNAYSVELDIGTTRIFTIYCDRGIISFFTGRGICVSVIHQEAGFHAGVRELLERVTPELAQIYAP